MSKIKLVEFVASTAILITCFCCDKTGILCASFSLAASIYFLFTSRRCPLLFIVSLLLFLCTYSFLIGDYLYPFSDFDFSFDDNYEIRLTAAKATLLFFYFLILFVKKNKKEDQKNKNIKNPLYTQRDNPIIVIFLLLCIVAIWFLFYKFSFGTRADYSATYEYATVLFVLAFYFAGNNKKMHVAIVFVAAFYVLFDFLGGQRSTGAQISIIVAISLFYKKITYKRVLLIAFLGLLLVNAIAAFRVDDSFSFSAFSLSKVLKDTASTRFVSDTASFAYYTSNIFLLAKTHFSSLELFKQFLDYMASQFVVGTVGESITTIALKYHYHFYGGVLPIYLYYYLGYFGVFLIALLVSFYANLLKRFNYNKRNISYVVSIYITASSIRWFLYSPNQLIRSTLILIVLYFILKQFDSLFYYKRRRNVDERCLFVE